MKDNQSQPAESVDLRFRFLSAWQFLELKELTSRQSSTVTPQPRGCRTTDDNTNDSRCFDNVNDDDALIYIFISHRWAAPGNPDDADRRQLRALQQWLRYVQDLFEATVLNGSSKKEECDNNAKILLEHSWPRDLTLLVEGMPQAASLVSRILKRNEGNNKLQTTTTINQFLDRIFLWYDCLCLPQNISPHCRTPAESQEFGWALQNLDLLAQDCELVCLYTDDYFDRAWCSFEHYQKSLSHWEGHLGLDWDKLLRGYRVEWAATATEKAEEEQNNNNRDANIEDAVETDLLPHLKQVKESLQTKTQENDEKQTQMLERSRRQQMQRVQTLWDDLHNQVAVAAASDNPNDNLDVMKVPDLERARIRIQNISLQLTSGAPPPPPPLENAVTCLIRELFAAVFCMSCRDAAAWKNRDVTSSSFVPIPPESNACIPNVGIQCGLHDHRKARPLSEQNAALRRCFQASHRLLPFGALVCPNGHRLEPGLATVELTCDCETCRLNKGKNATIAQGQAHATCRSCDYDICFVCATTGDGDSTNNTALSQQGCFDAIAQACNAVSPPNETKSTAVLCERRVTLDIFQLTSRILQRHGLACTNNSDVSFVGLLALKNILSRSTNTKDIHGANKEEGKSNDNKPKLDLQRFVQTVAGKQEGNGDPDKDNVEFSAGSFSLLHSVLDKIVVLCSNLLATNKRERLESLKVSIQIVAPRWVFLDLAFTEQPLYSMLTVPESFQLSRKAHQYFESNPNSISVDFDEDSASLPLHHQFCDNPGCNSGWAHCKHSSGMDIRTLFASAKRMPVVLDPWAESRFPTTLSSFVCLPTEDTVYIIGGTNGNDQTPEGDKYTSCLSSVYRALLPMTHETRFQKTAGLIEARRNHAGCLRYDKNGPATLIVSGGRGTGHPSEILSSVECFDLKNPNAAWTSTITLPRPRSAHAMVCLGDVLFVFGGTTQEAPTEDSQICDIYNFRSQTWSLGPKHPVAFAGGRAVLIENKFIFYLGGLIGQRFLADGWFLSVGAWFDWVCNGSKDEERPSSTWKKGPSLPDAMLDCNLCYAPRKATGLKNDWLLSVGGFGKGFLGRPKAAGDFCFGLRMPLDALHDKMEWGSQGELTTLRSGFITYKLPWTRLFSTVDGYYLGAQFVASGTLTLIGGESMSQSKVLDVVRTRKLPHENTINAMHGKPVSYKEEGTGNAKILINDAYLESRLGFPLPEVTQFSQDGTKTLLVLGPRGLHCQLCLMKTHSLTKAKASNDCVFFGIRPYHKNNPRRVILCSICLCDLYYRTKQG